MTEPIQYDRVYTTRELGEAVGLAPTYIAKLCQQGQLKAARPGWAYQILGASWMNWVASHMPCRDAPERWMTVPKAAQHCAVSENAIYRWIRDGWIPETDDGEPGAKRMGPRAHLVHGTALRKVVTLPGRGRKR